MFQIQKSKSIVVLCARLYIWMLLLCRQFFFKPQVASVQLQAFELSLSLYVKEISFSFRSIKSYQILFFHLLIFRVYETKRNVMLVYCWPELKCVQNRRATRDRTVLVVFLSVTCLPNSIRPPP